MTAESGLCISALWTCVRHAPDGRDFYPKIGLDKHVKIEASLFREASISMYPAMTYFHRKSLPAIVGAERLNFCVRDGYRWGPFAYITGAEISLKTIQQRLLLNYLFHLNFFG